MNITHIKNLESFHSTETTAGTSFYDNTVKASVNELTEVVGKPWDQSNNGQEKVNFEWTCATIDGDVFTIYDWKEYRSISEYEQIDWHIGGHSRIQTSTIADRLDLELNKLRLNKL